nr:MAG TPA: hypothetical protein [Caudoviricetes sp.]
MKGGLQRYVSYDSLFTFVIMVCAIITLANYRK